MEAKEFISKENLIHRILKANDHFPNNEILPLIIYRQVLQLRDDDPAASVEEIFNRNLWLPSWRNGIYDYHHYHSISHEVLGVYSGKAKVQLGGPGGFIAEVEKSDIIIIPAGVAHKNLGASHDFKCVGAYPEGQSFDMNYGKTGERPQVDDNIRNVPLPQCDPVFGSSGPLTELWFNKI